MHTFYYRVRGNIIRTVIKIICNNDLCTRRKRGSVVFWCLFLLHQHYHRHHCLMTIPRPPTFLRRCQIALPYAAPRMADVAIFTTSAATPATLGWPYIIIIINKYNSNSNNNNNNNNNKSSPLRLHDAVLYNYGGDGGGQSATRVVVVGAGRTAFLGNAARPVIVSARSLSSADRS